MADIRINSLPTTASASSSDDFLALDGATNGTRKLNAYSPTFGGNVTASGNLTVSGTGTQTLNGKLDVITAASSAANVDIAVLRQNYAGTAGHEGLISFTNISGTSVGKIGTRAVDGSNTSLVLRNFVSGSLADALTLSPSVATLAGNLTVSGTAIGLGGSTVPAWSSHNVLQTSDLASFGSFTGNKNAQVMHNAFWNGSAYKYIETAASSYYAQTAGVHSWFTAASGTAGNTITFAEAARITSGGNLLIGTTTDSGNGKLQLATHTTSAGGIGFGTDTSLFRAASGNLGLYGTGTSSKITFSHSTTTAGKGFDVECDSAKDGYVWNRENRNIFFGTNNTLALTLDSSQNATFAGKVGIGVSPASWELNLQQSATNSAVRIISPTALGLNDSSIYIAWASGSKALIAASYESTGSYRPLVLSAGGVDSLTLDTSGNSTFAGNIKTAAPSGGTAATWRLGTVASVSPTSPNRTIEVEIGGTTYYIHAKTTNN